MANGATGRAAFHGPTNISFPTLTPYTNPAGSSTGASSTAVIVAPGGAFNFLSWGKESHHIGHWLAGYLGVSAFVLTYRCSWQNQLPWGAQALVDAQRAVRLLRHNHRHWKLNASRIGFLGLSAGGYLPPLLYAYCQPGQGVFPAVDAVDKASCLPSFALMIYGYYLACDPPPEGAFSGPNMSQAFTGFGVHGLSPLKCPHGGGETWVLTPGAAEAPRGGAAPPFFMAAELSDAMASVGSLLWLDHLTGARSLPSAAARARAAIDSARPAPGGTPHARLVHGASELHLWNSSGAHGSGIACLGSPDKAGFVRARPELAGLSMCRAWPYYVADFFEGLGLASALPL